MSNILYIIGGGPSLRQVPDWPERLQAQSVWVVNRAWEKLPTADLLFFSDMRFWGWYGKEILRNFKGRIATSYKLQKPVSDKIEWYPLRRRSGLTTDKGYLSGGNNTGYATLNLAVQEGYTNIILLGFDMQRDEDDNSHWHDGYSVDVPEEVYSKMLPYWKTIAPSLKTLGVEVINASPDSRITCFPKIPLEEAFPQDALQGKLQIGIL